MTDRDSGADESDHDLVARAKSGDNTAFDCLMVRHYPLIAGHMRRYTASSHIIEELSQTVFVKAFLNLGSYRAIAPFGNWLRVIASRVGYDYWRQEKKRRAVTFHADMDVFRDQAVVDSRASEDFDRVEQVINRLEYADRQVLYMLHVDEMSIADIADAMGWNHSMTKMRAFRARNKLRKILQSGK